MGYAMAELNNAYNAVKSMQGLNKPCILAETGWLTEGTSISGSLAVPGMENSRAYWDAIHNWSKDRNVEVFRFNAYDEHWKPVEADLDARHWGIFYGNGQPKEGFTDLFSHKNPPTGIHDVKGNTALMFVFSIISMVLWVYILRRRIIN